MEERAREEGVVSRLGWRQRLSGVQKQGLASRRQAVCQVLCWALDYCSKQGRHGPGHLGPPV